MIVCKVLKIVEEEASNAVTLDFGNDCVVEVKVGRDEGVEALKAGARYSVALVPFVEISDADATRPVVEGDQFAPIEHPTVMHPSDACVSEPAPEGSVVELVAPADASVTEQAEASSGGACASCTSPCGPVAEAATEVIENPEVISSSAAEPEQSASATE